MEWNVVKERKAKERKRKAILVRSRGERMPRKEAQAVGQAESSRVSCEVAAVKPQASTRVHWKPWKMAAPSSLCRVIHALRGSVEVTPGEAVVTAAAGSVTNAPNASRLTAIAVGLIKKAFLPRKYSYKEPAKKRFAPKWGSIRGFALTASPIRTRTGLYASRRTDVTLPQLWATVSSCAK